MLLINAHVSSIVHGEFWAFILGKLSVRRYLLISSCLRNLFFIQQIPHTWIFTTFLEHGSDWRKDTVIHQPTLKAG